ncbi:TcpQ domain-containing protein [Solidesulfovibrio carbinoliphilus]|nr:TcpQ domain-containing protein [Solidesulfovibrio carbinoliphilus]
MRGSRTDTGGMTAYDGVSADYPGDAQTLAASVAEEMAHRYPPARTTLALVKTDSSFGQDLESALRERGFPVAAPDASGMRVAYTLDVIHDETPPTCYVRVRTSDGVAFGTLRALTGETRRTKGDAPAEGVPSVAALAPEPRPLNDALPVVVSAPRPAPVMPAKLERRAGSARDERADVPVRVKSTAAKIAKRNKVPVGEFCRLNDVAPDTVIPAGRRVLLHEPHEPAVALTPLPEPARAGSPSEVRQPKFSPIRTLAAADAPPTIQPAVAVRPVETPPAPVKAPDPAPAVSSPPAGPSPVSKLLSENAAPAKSASNPPAPVPAAPATATPVQPVSAPVVSAPTPPVVSSKPVEHSTAPAGETGQTPPPIAPVAPEWAIDRGSLHSQLETWATRAQYQLIWKATHDFDLEARASFGADFVLAIQKLFSALQHSGHALRVTVYQGNNVLEVADN